MSAPPPAQPEVEFWDKPDRTGWLMKQGKWWRSWRRRWFVMKQGKLFWFKNQDVDRNSVPRGVIEIAHCLSVRGAEDSLNKPHSFEISTSQNTQYFVADDDKEKEDWISSIGSAIVRLSSSMQEDEVANY